MESEDSFDCERDSILSRESIEVEKVVVPPCSGENCDYKVKYEALLDV